MTWGCPRGAVPQIEQGADRLLAIGAQCDLDRETARQVRRSALVARVGAGSIERDAPGCGPARRRGVLERAVAAIPARGNAARRCRRDVGQWASSGGQAARGLQGIAGGKARVVPPSRCRRVSLTWRGRGVVQMRALAEVSQKTACRWRCGLARPDCARQSWG